MTQEGHQLTILWGGTAVIVSFCVTQRILEFVFWKTETVFKAQVMANYMSRKCWGKASFPRFRIMPSAPSKDCGYVCYWFLFSYYCWFCRLFPWSPLFCPLLVLQKQESQASISFSFNYSNVEGANGKGYVFLIEGSYRTALALGLTAIRRW